jgi:hypothetical protein
VVTTSVPETVAAIVRIDPIGGTAHLFEDGTFAI